MRTGNAKTSPPQAQAETPAQETTAGAAPVAAAVVQPQAPTAPADKFRGQGGLYTMKSGKRVRVAAPAATTEEQQ